MCKVFLFNSHSPTHTQKLGEHPQGQKQFMAVQRPFLEIQLQDLANKQEKVQFTAIYAP
jgi:hypothetical protein